jgi:cell wall-associated NlpC family hydrolase
MQNVLAYAFRLIGIPYKWGGSNPVTGFDCSGLVQEILSSAGIDPSGDQSAQALYDYFEKNGSFGTWGAGALAFFGKDAKNISHVAFCIDTYRMIEAGGGDHLVLTTNDAAAKNAFVRVRLIKSRKDFVAVIKPSYAPIGIP